MTELDKIEKRRCQVCVFKRLLKSNGLFEPEKNSNNIALYKNTLFINQLKVGIYCAR